jgi:hypothetical protein
MKTVFVVHHIHILPQGAENVKMIGVYRTENLAREAIARLRTQPGFCALPNIYTDGDSERSEGFSIDAYALDQDHWCEGYVTT